MPDRARDRERPRERESRKRRRREFEEDEDEGGISSWKVGLVIGVIVVCFAMLYPALFHPMLMGLMGSKQQQPTTSQARPPIHPAMGGGGAGGGRHPGPGVRPDVHPAMRMAHAQTETQSGGRGMFTWMLPLYTVGVVVFLLYTLFKSKKNKKKKRRYDESSEEEDDESDVNDVYNGKRLGKKKLRGLQERLRQTEEAMTKILEQLETVQAGDLGLDLDALEEASKAAEQDESVEVDDGEKPSTSKAPQQNEQYINDLEKALKDFKDLSREYENAKIGGRRYKKRDSEDEEEEEDNEEENTSDGELNSEASTSESEDEPPPPPPPPKKSKSKNKSKAKKKIEDKSEKEEEEVEEEGIDIDAELAKESLIKSQPNNDNNKKVRRRPKKT
ncbi:unnamed protein product [Caenorhabditis auriculariae]|uniref:Resistance to inhibitors of cholinesterase protein 3 N-terminal domain-containing protein n=1 Tax=Caenorhabditis auriculariae TaxID=2777116 RepID=A0A8S1HHT7_9PELO|nr:unnamed protein product [Caenorhabditis auriculariae]